MPFHIDYTGPANVSRFMKIEKVKLEELVEERKEPLKDEEVGGMERRGEGEAPMDTDAPGTEGPTPLRRTATDVEMHDSNITTTAITGAMPNADEDTETPPFASTATATMLSTARTESTLIESQSTLIESQPTLSTSTSTTLASSSSMSLSQHPTTATAAPPTLLEDADKRFISTFRGRTIHGLTIDLPPGYGGLVLRREGNDAVPGTGDANVADIKGKGRPKSVKNSSAGTKGKGKEEEQQKQSKKAPPRRGRLTRSATISKPEVIAVDEEPAQEGEGEGKDDKMADTTPTLDGVADEEVPNEYPVRRLVPHAQFSSFTLWHQDRPVDKGRDEYCRTLTEWIALSHEVNLLVFSEVVSVVDTLFLFLRFTGLTCNSLLYTHKRRGACTHGRECGIWPLRVRGVKFHHTRKI